MAAGREQQSWSGDLPPWKPEPVACVTLRVEPLDGGARLIVDQVGWDGVVGRENLQGWFASQVLGSLLVAMAPQAVADWFTDRRARRPWGASALAIYVDPLYHWPEF